MGNTTSGVLKILSPFTGTLDVFSKPIRASDIISPNSSHFITDSSLLQVGHRVTSVSPEEFLRPRRDLYLVLPIDMLFSVLTVEEFTLISDNTAEILKKSRHSHLKRIFPVCIFPVTGDRRRNSSSVKNIDEDVDIRESVEKKMVMYESKHGSWRPGLETIMET